MAKTDLYVKLEISPSSGVVYTNERFHESLLEEEYNEAVKAHKGYGWSEKFESLEGYKLQYILLKDVKYDGRKRRVTDDDIGIKLSEMDLTVSPKIIKGETPLFGHTFKATEKLETLLSENLNKRKQLIAEGKYILLSEAV